MPRSRVGLIASIVAAGALLAWPLAIGSPYAVNLFTGAVIWGLFALSYDLVVGWTGEVSFGHALWFGTGVYGAALLLLHTPLPTAAVFVAVPLLAAPAALLVNALCLRLSGAYFAMITFAIAEFVHLLVENATALTGGTNGLVGVPLAPWTQNGLLLYELSAALLIAFTLLVLAARQRSIGLVAHAARDNPVRLGLLGVSPTLVKVLVLTAASVIATLAGVLYLAYQGMAFAPTLDSQTSFTVLLMAIIGGVDSAWGPAAAGVLLTLLETWLNSTTTHWTLILGVIYVLVVRFLPRGFGGLGALDLRGLAGRLTAMLRWEGGRSA
jgi:branched-chain amino acid transport system permease protein